eukprot:s3058_g12.t1
MLENHLPTRLAESEQGDLWRVPGNLVFEPSVQAIASVYDDVDAARKRGGVDMSIVLLELTHETGQSDQTVREVRGSNSLEGAPAMSHFQLCYKTVRRIPVRKLRLKRHKPRTSVATGGDPHPLEDGSDDDDEDNNEHDDDMDSIDDDADSMADELFGIYERELAGECDESLLDEFEQNLESDQQYQDVSSMDDINLRFVATVMENHDGRAGLAKHERAASSHELHADTLDETEQSRPFEDETGEEMLQQFMQDKLSKENKNIRVVHPAADMRPIRKVLDQFQIDASLALWKQSFTKSLEACVCMHEGLKRLDTFTRGVIGFAQQMRGRCGGMFICELAETIQVLERTCSHFR